VGDATPDENSIELAADATSSNITVDTLDDNTEYTVSATASVTGKVLSNVTSLAIETDPLPVYTAATGGTTEEYDLDGKRYKSHTFTSSGTFEVTTVGDATDDRNQVDYLVIAGGGGGGANLSGVSTAGGSGGGAGGFRTTVGTQGRLGTLDSKVTVTATSYSVTSGGGGAGAVRATGGLGVKGTDSSVAFGSTITSEGGGGGASRDNLAGGNGGSGGGGNSGAAGGTGETNQGFDGGSSTSTPSGGGGAGQAGTNGGTNFDIGYAGGDGLANLLRTGSNETRAGGGGSGGRITGVAGSGGAGGGGAGGQGSQNGFNGTANTGGGAGGAGGSDPSAQNGGAGGSGIVIIRYEIAPSV